MSDREYDWVAQYAKYCPEENEKLPWGVDVKFKDGGYGKKYYSSLDDALYFIEDCDVDSGWPF